MLITDRPYADVDALRSRLHGDVVGPDDAGWDEARRAWNLAIDQRPAAVAFPLTDSDVVAVVDFAREEGLRVAAQATGHGAGAIASLEDTILISTKHMRGVRIDPGTRRARVRAGAVWADVTGPAATLRAGAAGRLGAGRRGRRLHARRRAELARSQARPRVQQRRRDRAGDRRRPPRPRRRRARPGAVLGAARRRRAVRRRDRDRVRAPPRRRAAGRRADVAGRARRGDLRRLARLDDDRAGRGHVAVPDRQRARRPVVRGRRGRDPRRRRRSWRRCARSSRTSTWSARCPPPR